MQKQAKRLSALEEVMVTTESEPNLVPEEAKEVETTPAADTSKQEDGGILGKIKGFYEKADSMAASQALLLNKELEDRGVVEKITDETGLKVIGKEAASKLESDERDDVR